MTNRRGLTPRGQTPFTILVTRPEEKGLELCNHLKTQGCHAIHFPTIAFAPPKDLPNKIDIDSYDIFIFISPKAVDASEHLLPKNLSTKTLVAVGGGTQKALEKIGHRESISPDKNWGSEGLLDLPVMRQVIEKKILIIRGEGGRELLADTLKARGAEVSHLIVYQRVLPQIDTKPILELMKKKQIHAIVCTSNTAVNHLVILLSDMAEYLKTLPLIVVSDRIKVFAKEQKFQSVFVAENASHESIIKIALQIRNKL